MNRLSSIVFPRVKLVFMLLLVLVAAAGSGTVQPARALDFDADRTLRVIAGDFPAHVDPQKSAYLNQIGHLNLIYEGLTRLDTDLATVPAAAASWEYNLDSTLLTLHLREGLTYSDGTVLNALRFEYAILRTLDPRTQSEYAMLFDAISGASEFLAADPTVLTEAQLLALRDAVAVNSYSVTDDQPCTGYDQVECRILRIGLTHTATYFHTMLSLWVTYPARQESIEAGGEYWWQNPVYQVGNGPFILNSLDAVEGSFFTPNSRYWQGAPGYDILYVYQTDYLAGLSAYQANQVDIMPITPDISAQVIADPTLNSEAHTYSGSCTYAIMYHNLKAPFDNRYIREAFSYALDRQAWVDEVMGGLGFPTLTWIPPGYPGYDGAEDRWDYSPAAALTALANSGYTVNAEGKLVNSDSEVVDILDSYSDSPRNRMRHEWLAAQWLEVLGIQITLNPVDAITYTEITHNFETAPLIYIMGWCADYPDPQNWLSVYWHTGAFAARIGYSNTALDALLETADATSDPVTRLDLYAQAQDMLVGDVPVTFMWNNERAYLAKSRVGGLVETPQDILWVGDLAPLLITLVPAPPSAGSLEPHRAVAGDPGFTLTVNGDFFTEDAVVRWNGADRATTFVSETQLTAEILAGDIAAVGWVPVTVYNQADGNLSNALEFTVTAGIVDLSWAPHTSAVTVGQSFDVAIEVNAGTQQVDGVAAYINFNTAFLQVESVTPGSTFPIVMQNQFDNVAGHVDFTGVTLTEFPSGTFTLATIRFQSIAVADLTLLEYNNSAPRQTDATFGGESVLGWPLMGLIEIGDTATLHGTVTLQGRPTPPDPRWSVPLTVTLTVPGESTPAYTFTPTTDTSGAFEVGGIVPGTYDVRVKHSHTLTNLKTVTLVPEYNEYDFGTLLEGDTNNDNYVSLLDFSILVTTYAKCEGMPGYDSRADFNGDTCVTLLDFSLLATNYSKGGDQVITDSPAIATPTQSDEPVIIIVDPPTKSLLVGQTFTITIQVQAGSALVNGAQGSLDFDPTKLRVKKMTGSTTALPMTIYSTYDNTAGTLDYAAGTFSNFPTGDINLVQVEFEALAATEGTTLAFHYGLPRVTDVTYGGISILTGDQNGTFEINEGVQTFLPMISR